MSKKFLSIVFLSVLINACSNDRSEESISLVDNFDRGSMLTNLSDNIIIPSYEGFGFVYSLQFTRKPGTSSAYFSTSEVNGFISTLTAGNGLWDITADQLDTMSETIAARFGISVAQAGS